jgi:hypothetical protein
VVPEFLALVNIRDMDFHKRNRHPRQRIAQATLVWVSPPGLMTIASTPSSRAAWMRSISAPSWLL